MEIMATKEIAQKLVNDYRDLIGKRMKTPMGILRIDDVQLAEWETGHWYNVFLVGHLKSKLQKNTIDEIRINLFEYLEEMGLLIDEQPNCIHSFDKEQKYFTNNINLALLVANKFSHLTKSNRKFSLPYSKSEFNIDYLRVFLMPNEKDHYYQVLFCNEPIKNKELLMKKDLKGIQTKDLLVYLEEIGHDINKDEHLKQFIQFYL